MEVKNLGFWRTVVANSGNDGEDLLFKVIGTERNAIHASLIYNPEFSGDMKWRVLLWRIDVKEQLEPSGPYKAVSRIWNPNYEDPLLPPSTARITRQIVPPWNSSTYQELLFCSGHAFMADGKLLVGGGHIPVSSPHPFAPGHPLSYIFDPFDLTDTDEGTWKHATIPEETATYQYMNDGRWYPTLTQLPDDRVVAMSGYRTNYDVRSGQEYLVLNKKPGIYSLGTQLWITLEDTEALVPATFEEYENPHGQPHHEGVTYPAGFVIPYGDYKGKIFYAAPIRQSYIFDPDGNSTSGYWFEVGTERTDLNCGSCTFMLPLDPTNSSVGEDVKIVTAGGRCHTAVADAFMINLNPSLGSNDWTPLPDMHFPRTHANAVLLPDGNVLVVGGNEMDNYGDPVYHAELFMPDTPTGEKWVVLPAMQFPRNYHSTAILLPDARVWVGGGDLSLDEKLPTTEIFTPQYLIEGPRPEILTSEVEISYTRTFEFTTHHEIEKVILIRQGTTTHALNTSQRAIYLRIDGYDASSREIVYTVSAPDSAEIAQPGWYMMFIVLPKSSSDSGEQAIPSVAKFVHLT